MKSIIITLSIFLLAVGNMVAQAPQSFKYQTVVRNTDGTVIANDDISFRLTLVINGNEVYQEEQSTQTNAFGLASFAIGEGDSDDDFSAVNWASGTVALEVEVDVNGGTNYTLLGTSILHSVPYALFAENTASTDDADADPANEIQTLSINGNTLSISGGNAVELPESGASAEAEELAKAWVNVPITGTVNVNFDAYNVTSVTHTATGVYVVNLSSGLFSVATNPAVVCTVNNDLAPGFAIPTFSPSPSAITVRTYDASGNLSDRGFSLIIHGK